MRKHLSQVSHSRLQRTQYQPSHSLLHKLSLQLNLNQRLKHNLNQQLKLNRQVKLKLKLLDNQELKRRMSIF